MENIGGRPTKFKPEYVKQVEGLCRIGALDSDIADFFGVTETTINNWKLEHPRFFESIKRGKAVADREVAQKLIDRAMGAEFIEQKEVKLKQVRYNKQGRKTSETEKVVIVDLKKQAPPDTTAIMFFLRNRRRDLWPDRQLLGSDPENPLPANTFTLKIDNG